MNMFQLVLGQFLNLRLNPMVCIMMVLITIRTFVSGNAIMLTGLCMAFLPFFSQTKNLTCFAVEVSEERELFSRYLMSYLLMILGLLYLKAVTTLGAAFYPGYVENPLLRETFLLAMLCNLVFISVIVPLTYALNLVQRFMVASILCVAEIGFMVFAKQMLTLLQGSYALTGQWGLYLLMIMIPFNALLFVKLNGRLQKQFREQRIKAEV